MMKVSTKIVSILLPTTGCLHLVLVVTAVVLAKHSILTSFLITISPVIEPNLCKRKRKRKEGKEKEEEVAHLLEAEVVKPATEWVE